MIAHTSIIYKLRIQERDGEHTHEDYSLLSLKETEELSVLCWLDFLVSTLQGNFRVVEKSKLHHDH